MQGFTVSSDRVIDSWGMAKCAFYWSQLNPTQVPYCQNWILAIKFINGTLVQDGWLSISWFKSGETLHVICAELAIKFTSFCRMKLRLARDLTKASFRFVRSLIYLQHKLLMPFFSEQKIVFALIIRKEKEYEKLWNLRGQHFLFIRQALLTNFCFVAAIPLKWKAFNFIFSCLAKDSQPAFSAMMRQLKVT